MPHLFMPLAALFTFACVVYFGIHAYKRGKYFWIYLMVFLNWIGILIYFFVEFLPAYRQSGQAREAGQLMEKFFFPEKELKLRADTFENAPTHVNRMSYADALQKAGRFGDALEIYQAATQGINRDDPQVWEGIGHAHFMLGNMPEAIQALEQRAAFRSSNRADEFDLLLARARYANGQEEAARQDFERLAEEYSGEEARCRYALLLKEEGKVEEARELFEETLRYVRLSPRHYQRAQQQWIRIAQSELKK